MLRKEWSTPPSKEESEKQLDGATTAGKCHRPVVVSVSISSGIGVDQ